MFGFVVMGVTEQYFRFIEVFVFNEGEMLFILYVCVLGGGESVCMRA
jgi:hypothetical protein